MKNENVFKKITAVLAFVFAGFAFANPAAAQGCSICTGANGAAPAYMGGGTSGGSYGSNNFQSWSGAQQAQANYDTARMIVNGQGKNQRQAIDRAGAWNLGGMVVGGMITRANMTHQAELEAPLIVLRGDQEVRVVRAKGDEQRQTNDNQTDNQIRWGQWQRGGTTTTATQGGEITLDPSRCRQNSNGTVTCQR